MKKLIGMGLLATITACSGYDSTAFDPQSLALFLLVSSPGVRSTSPANSTNDVSLNSGVAITFNQDLDDTTLSIQASDGDCTGSIQLSADDFTTCLGGTLETTDDTNYTFRPASAFTSNTNYKLRVLTTIRNPSGAYLSREYLMGDGFTTGGETTATISHSTSANPRPLNNTITLGFDRDMDAGTVSVLTSDGTCAGNIQVSRNAGFTNCLALTLAQADSQTLTVTGNRPLLEGATHYVRVTNSLLTADSNPVTDTSGNFRVFSPGVTSDVSTQPLVWLRGSNNSVGDGVAVGTWGNEGFGADFTTAAGGPTQENSEVNGYAVVRFSGFDRLSAASTQLFTSTSSPLVVYMLIRPAVGNTANQSYYLHLDGGDFAMGHNLSGSGAGLVGVNRDGGAASGATHGTSAISDNTFQLVAVRITGAGGFEIYQDGVSQTTNTVAPGYFGTTFYPTVNVQPLNLGSLLNDTFRFTGDIAEVLIYRSEMTGELTRLNCYFAQKYSTGTACN